MDIQVTTIQITVADPREEPLPPPPPPPPLFLDQAETKELDERPPPSLSQGLNPALNYTSSTMLSYGTVVQGGLN